MRRAFASVAFALAAASLCPSIAYATPSLEAGWGHNLAVSPAGGVWAWGENDAGKLGNGTTTNSPIPVRSGNLTNVVAVAAGADFSVALRSDGTVWTWGSGASLGVGTAPGSCVNTDFPTLTYPCSKVPVQVTGISGATAIAAGTGHALILLRDGTVRAWGLNSFGQLGNGTVTDATIPVTVTGLAGVTKVAAGHDFSLAVRSDGSAWAWGNGTHGELGTGTTALSACAGKDPYNSSATSLPCARTPVQVPGITGVFAIAARGRHTLALRNDGSVWAWGSNQYGQMGDATTSNRLSPYAVPGMASVTQVAAGFSHSVVLKSDGTLWVWGLNNSGQMGVTSTQNCATSSGALGAPCARSPVQDASHSGATLVVAGGAHTITVRPDGTLVAYGLNASGQLGYGSAQAATTLIAIDPHSPFNLIGGIGSGTSIWSPSGLGGLNIGTIDYGLTFTAQAVGTSSASREVRFSNLTDAPLSVLSVTVYGNFSATGNCGGTLAGNASCSVFVTFTPPLPGRRQGTLTFTTSGEDARVVPLPLTGVGTSNSIPVNLSDIWWNPNESGWGLTIADHETNLFVVWYTYDASGKPAWFTIPGGTFSGNDRYFSGDVYTTTGPCYSAATFNPALVRGTRVGTALFDFAPADLPSGWARFSGTIGTTSWNKSIQRQPFGNASSSWGSDYTDIWWNAAESGWGLTLSQHGDNIFGVLYTYDCDGSPLFVVLPGVTFSASNRFTGDLYTTRASGSWWGSVTFNPAQVAVSRVGTATITFSGSSATFSATINGSTRTRAVVQQPFGHRAPGVP
jgi:alpha-tubulin suppressor-like RCC1 family protein